MRGMDGMDGMVWYSMEGSDCVVYLDVLCV